MGFPSLPQFGTDYDGYKMRVLVDELDRQFRELQAGVASAATTGGAGVTLHNALTGRSDADCHPISAITNLTSTLSGLAPLSAIVTSHNVLTGRSDADCHPISAITGLTAALASIDHNTTLNLTVGDVHTQYFFLAGRTGARTAVLSTDNTGSLTLAAGTSGAFDGTIFGSGTTARFLTLRSNSTNLTTGSVLFPDSLQSTSPTTGAAIFSGGVGIAKRLNVLTSATLGTNLTVGNTGTAGQQNVLATNNQASNLGTATIRFKELNAGNLFCWNNAKSGSLPAVTFNATSNGMITTTGVDGTQTATLNANSFTKSLLYSDTATQTATITNDGICLADVSSFTNTTCSTAVTVGGNCLALGIAYSGGANGITSSLIATGLGSVVIGVCGSSVAAALLATNLVEASGGASLNISVCQAATIGAVARSRATGAATLTLAVIGGGDLLHAASVSIALVGMNNLAQTVNTSGVASINVVNLSSTGFASNSGSGSLLLATITGAVSATNTGNNSGQIGPGACTENDTWQLGILGAGLRLRGTTTAFIVPTNGDIRQKSSGSIEAFSFGIARNLSRVYLCLSADIAAQGTTAVTTEENLMAYTLPGGTLATNGDAIFFKTVIATSGGGNTKRVKVKFGATTIYDTTALALISAIIIITGKIIRTGAVLQLAYVEVTSNSALLPATALATIPVETLANNIVLQITGQNGVVGAANDIGNQYLSVDLNSIAP